LLKIPTKKFFLTKKPTSTIFSENLGFFDEKWPILVKKLKILVKNYNGGTIMIFLKLSKILGKIIKRRTKREIFVGFLKGL
jgi:hypothetical protein